MDVKEVVENDYNLNVTLYVVPIEEGEKINISKEFFEMKKLEKERLDIGKKLEEYVSQLSKAIGD